jgi:hypothetical protein
MTLHQQIPTIAPVSNRPDAFRLKALSCEQRARESTDPRSRQGWEELAIDWHAMSNRAAGTSGEHFLILESSDMPLGFGIDDLPTCLGCKGRMRLTRRAPHPIHGNAFELQTFTCRTCRHQIERGVDRLGEVIA